MDATTRLKVPAKGVAADILDDEVVIVNLVTGHYFSTEGTGCEVWTLLAAGVPVGEVIETITARYGEGIDEVPAYVDHIVTKVLDGGLMIIDDDTSAEPAVSGSELLPPSEPGRGFSASPFLAFDDMESLLLLDPVHDVDDKGWPHAAPGV